MQVNSHKRRSGGTEIFYQFVSLKNWRLFSGGLFVCVYAFFLAIVRILRYDTICEVINMEKITSFTIDHIRLQPGLYVSRKDKVGAETVTTFDLRLTDPNEEPVMNTAEVHAIEHLGATFLRNEPQWKDKVLYFGPMGCRTGFYLLLAGDLESEQIVPLIKDCFEFIRDYRGEIPGASAKDCGNYLDMNLSMANYWGRKYAALLENIDRAHLIYPE